MNSTAILACADARLIFDLMITYTAADSRPWIASSRCGTAWSGITRNARRISPPRSGSIGACQKVGMKREGVLRDVGCKDGVYYYVISFGILATDSRPR